MKARTTLAEARKSLEITAERFGLPTGPDGLDLDKRDAGLSITWKQGRDLIGYRLTPREVDAAMMLAHELIRLKEGWED